MNDNKLNSSSVILSLKIYYCKRFLQTRGKQTHLDVPVMLLQTSYVSAILQQCLQKGSYYLQTFIFFVMTSLLETFVFRNGIRSDLNVSWKESRKAHRNTIANNLWILKITHKHATEHNRGQLRKRVRLCLNSSIWSRTMWMQTECIFIRFIARGWPRPF